MPSSLSEEIVNKYPDAHVVTLNDLDEDDKKQFQSEHASECPGLTSVNFYGDGKPTMAIVLSLNEDRGASSQPIVAHEVQNRWQLRPLDGPSTGPAPLVWHEGPGKYNDVYGEKTLKAIHPVIVLWGAYGSWAILYAWTGNRVEKIWIRD